jgi:hypothetical protein
MFWKIQIPGKGNVYKAEKTLECSPNKEISSADEEFIGLKWKNNT